MNQYEDLYGNIVQVHAIDHFTRTFENLDECKEEPDAMMVSTGVVIGESEHCLLLANLFFKTPNDRIDQDQVITIISVVKSTITQIKLFEKGRDIKESTEKGVN